MPVILIVMLQRITMVDVIKFYTVNGEYGEFTNFARYPIKIW